jgi:transposase-like protein
VDTSTFGTEEFTMADKAIRYTPEFKRQMVDLVRAGRTPASLAKEFGPTAWSISLWVTPFISPIATNSASTPRRPRNFR